jgi:hypothetical protein
VPWCRETKYDTELKKAAVRPATMPKKRVFKTFEPGGVDGNMWPAGTRLYPLGTAGATVASVSSSKRPIGRPAIYTAGRVEGRSLSAPRKILTWPVPTSGLPVG